MRKGPSIYYASDKNIYDALNQSKVDADTIQSMFRRRNIVCSRQTKREELSKFFSRLPHDLIDHKDLSDRLGIIPRRERLSSIDLVGGTITNDALKRAIDTLRTKLSSQGDTVTTSANGTTYIILIKYSFIDYKKSEFNQLQNRTGIIEIIQKSGTLVIRSTKNEYIDDVRDDLAREIQSEATKKMERNEISLFTHLDSTVRSKFFFDLIKSLPGYTLHDVSDVFVFKPRPEQYNHEDEDNLDTHIDRISMRGSGVSSSQLLRDLTKEKSYYIVKVGWIVKKNMGLGAGYEIEATFSDPEDCREFSYILRGVFDLGSTGKLLKNRRSPSSEEIEEISNAIEATARDLILKLNAEEHTENKSDEKV